MPPTRQLVLLALISAVVATSSPLSTKDDMGMDMEGPKEFHPINPGSKTFHWILSLFLLLVAPSFLAVLANSDHTHYALPLQLISTAYSAVEWLFIDFPDPNGHENKASKGTSLFLSLLLGATVFLGTFHSGLNWVMNKLAARKGTVSSGAPPIIGTFYRILSILVVFTGWVRVCLAPVALFGFCYGRHTGQCIAHGIMGSSFVAYGFLYLYILLVPWIRKHGLNPNDAPAWSQEFYDLTLMCAYGIVNTFTEHRWGKEPWNHGDYQHTAMGIIWWAGGLVGMWLTRRKNNTRSFIPALLLIFTGWAMSEHTQHLVISTKVHGMFGIVLMGAGFLRILEILLLLWDKRCLELGLIYSFQYFPSFLLVLSGILFMSANEEQLVLVKDLGADHLLYIMVATSAAFVIYLWFLLLIQVFLRLFGYDENGELGLAGMDPGYMRTATEEFELAELSDEDRER